MSTVLTAPLAARNYRALRTMARATPDFRDIILRYLTGGGTYPWVCRVRTPLGIVPVELYSSADVLTLNEVFFREDYATGVDVECVVDIGSNIGLSLLYFLTRNARVRCYAYEPDARNVARLRRNLAAFEGRYDLEEVAVADFYGEADFGLEPTGRYGAIGWCGVATTRVACRHVNGVLEDVLAAEREVDILKVDAEGLEETIVRAIRPDLLRRIARIDFESAQPTRALHEDSFHHSRRGLRERLVRIAR
jgi:FkbM family methyltransferase